MAQPDFARNLFGPNKFGDLSVTPIVVVTGATPRDAARSAPSTTVTDDTGGAYSFTFPAAPLFALCFAAQVGQAASVHAEVTAFDASAGTGTITLSDSGTLGAGEEIHILIVAGGN